MSAEVELRARYKDEDAGSDTGDGLQTESPPEEAPKTDWLNFGLAAFGAIFVLVDIGSDFNLAWEHSKKNSTKIFMFLVLLWLGTGGFAQTMIGIVMACRNRKVFSTLPCGVKFFTILASPVLLGPVVLYIFMMVKSYRGSSVVECKMIVSTIKIGEVLLESIPQVITNSIYFYDRCDRMRERCKYIYASTPPSQVISITTSILGTAYALADWMVSKNRDYIVGKNRHPMSSSIGLFLYCGFSISAMFNTAWCWHLTQLNSKKFYLQKRLIALYWAFIFVHMLLLILIPVSACLSSYCCKIYKYIVSTLSLFASAAWMIFTVAFFIPVLKMEKFFYAWHAPPLIMTIILQSGQFIVGILMLLSPRLGACVFDPLRRCLFGIMRKLTCGKLEEQIADMEQWEKSEVVHDESEDMAEERLVQTWT